MILLLSLPSVNYMVINESLSRQHLGSTASVFGNCYRLSQCAGSFIRCNSDAFPRQSLCCSEMLLCPLAPVDVCLEHQAGLTSTRSGKEINIHLYLRINRE